MELKGNIVGHSASKGKPAVITLSMTADDFFFRVAHSGVEGAP